MPAPGVEVLPRDGFAASASQRRPEYSDGAPWAGASIWKDFAYLTHHWLRFHPLDRNVNKLDILTDDHCRIRGYPCP